MNIYRVYQEPSNLYSYSEAIISSETEIEAVIQFIELSNNYVNIYIELLGESEIEKECVLIKNLNTISDL